MSAPELVGLGVGFPGGGILPAAGEVGVGDEDHQLASTVADAAEARPGGRAGGVELLVGENGVIRGKIAEGPGKEGHAEGFEALGEDGFAAVCVAQERAALFDEGFELPCFLKGRPEFEVAADVEDWGVVQLLGGYSEIDDLPLEENFGLWAGKGREVGDVAGSLVPVGGLGDGAGNDGLVVVELIHHDRRRPRARKRRPNAVESRDCEPG